MIKNINKIIVANFLAITLLTACHADEDNNANSTKTSSQMTDATQLASAGNLITGIVKETMDGGGYTYVSLEVDGDARWVAGPRTEVKVGSTISIAPPMPMNNFKSTALNREFDTIYFTGKILTGDADKNTASSMPHTPMPELAKSSEADPHAGMDMSKINAAKSMSKDSSSANEHTNTTTKKSMPIKGIKMAAGGKTIDDVLKQKKTLDGKQVKIRGKVTKFTEEVMNKNWIHIKDSSTGGDLTITTAGKAKVGDTVVVAGKIALDKDFGYGYIYDVILEDAKVTIE